MTGWLLNFVILLDSIFRGLFCKRSSHPAIVNIIPYLVAQWAIA
jgi:hypothetical protein